MRYHGILILTLILASGSWPRAQAAAFKPEVYPWIEELEGLAKVTLRADDGLSREAAPGDAWSPQETLQLPPGGYARVAFPDGSQLLLPPGAQARWAKSVTQERDKSYVAMLESGEVRVLVEKPKTESGIRFMVKTASAVMGVRGTDFLVAWKEPVTEVHAFSGWVELAKEEPELKQGLAVPVRAGERLVQAQGKPYEAPSAFDRVETLKALDERYPLLTRLWQSAVRSAKSGELLRKAQRVRAFQEKYVKAADAQAAPPSPGASGVANEPEKKAAPTLKMKRKSRRHWKRHR